MIFDPYDPEPDYAPDSPRIVFRDDVEPGKAYLINPAHMLTIPGDEIDWLDTHEDTYRLALESAQRWLNNYRLSPAMRLRALRSVVGAALATEEAQ